jgi:hypothetical protein
MTQNQKTKRGNENAKIQGKAVGTQVLYEIFGVQVRCKNNY